MERALDLVPTESLLLGSQRLQQPLLLVESALLRCDQLLLRAAFIAQLFHELLHGLELFAVLTRQFSDPRQMSRAPEVTYALDASNSLS